LPLFDGLPDFSQGGPRWLNTVLGAVGIVAGAGVGAWIGYGTAENVPQIVGGIGGFLLGGFVGWGAGRLLSGVLFFLFIFLIILIPVLGWQWLTGGL
jgi:hypothetical protein